MGERYTLMDLTEMEETYKGVEVINNATYKRASNNPTP